MSTFLVTGAAGFIGSNLTEHLLKEGHFVVALDNLSNGLKTNVSFLSSLPNAAQNLTIIEGDITNVDTCHKAVEGVDYVLHQAALGSVPRSIKHPALFHKNNTEGTLNMLIASKEAKVKRFVYASSSSVYGDTPTLPKVESMTPSPKSPYAINKITTEYYGKIFYELYKLPTIGLRYFNVFGPRQNPNSQYAAVIPKFITSFINNTSPIIHGDGLQTRDFTYVTNVIQANINACHADKKAFGEVFNIGCGKSITILKLAENIRDILGSNQNILHEATRSGDIKDSLANIEKAMSHLKLNNLISLEEGLKKTIDWFKAQS